MPITKLTGVISDTVVSLRAEDVQRSCGLALDIGATVGKIVYRSNKEYKNGMPIKHDASRGQVHYAMFHRSDVTGMINYIKDNCDLVAADSGELMVNSSGVGGAAFRTQMETGLNCRMKILPEFDCFCHALVALEKTTPAEELLMPLSPEKLALADAEIEKRKVQEGEMMKFINSHSQMKSGGIDACQGEVKDEDRPRLLMMAGSAAVVMQINRDGTFGLVDSVITGGRSMYGLAAILTGENDFDKLIEMAETSNGKTVDTPFSDLLGDRTGVNSDNVYGCMVQKEEDVDDDRRCMPFGKGITTPIDEMKKGDLAFSVFNNAVEIHCQLLRTCVMQSKAREVFICGNVFNSEFMKLLLYRLSGGHNLDLQCELKFLRNGGMYGALGAFLYKES